MGRGASTSTLSGWTERWGLISPSSDDSVGGMIREGVKAFEGSAALGDSVKEVCGSASFES
jgi:hypothetical protein